MRIVIRAVNRAISMVLVIDNHGSVALVTSTYHDRDIDLHAINTPPDATDSIQSLANYLTKRFSDEGHKARAIYRC